MRQNFEGDIYWDEFAETCSDVTLQGNTVHKILYVFLILSLKSASLDFSIISS